MSKVSKVCILAAGLWLTLLGYPQVTRGQPQAFAGTQYKVIYNFTPFSAVGKKKAGLLCLPNGRLVWSDIAPLNPAAINGVMERAFQREVLKIGADLGNIGITAYVARVDLSACAKNWAFGGEDSYKGRGTIVMEWKFEGSHSRTLPDLANTTSTFELDGAKQPLEAAFEAAARDVLTKVMM